MQRGTRPPGSGPSQSYGNGQQPDAAARPAPRTIPRRTVPRSEPPLDQPQSATMPRPSSAASLRNSSPPPPRYESSVSAYSRSRYTSTTAPTAPTRDPADQAEIERLGGEIEELLERVRMSEERTAYAEQQLTHMTHMANAAAAAATAVPRLPDFEPQLEARAGAGMKSSGSWIPWAAVALVTALAIAGYVLGYMPLREQFESQVKANLEQSTQHSQALTALESKFTAEREQLQSQLSAAQAAVAAAAAPAADPAAEAPSARSGGTSSSDSADEGGSGSSVSSEERAARAEERRAEREAKRAEREAKRAEREAEREARKAERAEKRAEASAAKGEDEEGPGQGEDEPAAEKPEAPSKPAEELGGDDPLEGLDTDGL